jgi:hypothetical protein
MMEKKMKTEAINNSDKEVVLEQFKYAVWSQINKELLLNADIQVRESEFSWIADDIVAVASMNIYGRDLEKFEFEYPADWWQAFKDRFFPDFIKKIYPVKYNKFIVDTRVLYPGFNPVNGHDPHFVTIVTSTPTNDEE